MSTFEDEYPYLVYTSEKDATMNGGGGSGGSGGIRVLEIEYPTPENPTLNASYNDLVGMAEAKEIAVIFDHNASLVLCDLYQEDTTYIASFKNLAPASCEFRSSDANQPMPML
jgi:hypothetical protein